MTAEALARCDSGQATEEDMRAVIRLLLRRLALQERAMDLLLRHLMTDPAFLLKYDELFGG